MNILLVLIPVSILLLALALWAFVWAVRRGQFEGLDSAALDILADERTPRAQGPQQSTGLETPRVQALPHPARGPR